VIDMDLIWLWVLVATVVAGVGSVWVAAWLTHGVLRRYTQHMLSFAAGALLGTAFLHLMPEALETGGDPHTLLTTLLCGLVFFFVMDKAELYHHGHEHGDLHGHHGHSKDHAHPAGGWVLLFGDSVHAFGDGVLIASAFLVDVQLGMLAALAVMAH
jgi:zinc and cadmium transporter